MKQHKDNPVSSLTIEEFQILRNGLYKELGPNTPKHDLIIEKLRNYLLLNDVETNNEQPIIHKCTCCGKQYAQTKVCYCKE